MTTARIIITVGDRFGHLTVLAAGNTDRSGNARWLCRCDCGTERDFISTRLRNGATKSCGCQSQASNRTHGASNSPEHVSWQRMRARCLSPTNDHYPSYGGRGITICERWGDFKNFLADMGPRPSPKHSLGRIDNNRGYEPDNCRWETAKQQARNRRDNRTLVVNGRKMTVAEAAEVTGIKYDTILCRLLAGRSDEDAIRAGS